MIEIDEQTARAIVLGLRKIKLDASAIERQIRRLEKRPDADPDLIADLGEQLRIARLRESEVKLAHLSRVYDRLSIRCAQIKAKLITEYDRARSLGSTLALPEYDDLFGMILPDDSSSEE